MKLSDFDLDLNFGLEGEAIVYELLTGGKTIEVKRDRRWKETGNLYIETECFYQKDNCWKLSGLRATKAEYWAFVLERMVLIVPTKDLINTVLRVNRPVLCEIPPNQSKGYLITVKDLIETNVLHNS